jgi:hypothetical protein
MNKTLFGLALLSYNWEQSKKDIIDSYIPLVCNAIRLKTYSKITRENVQVDLTDSYGINIPLGAIESILKRMAKDGLLNRQAGEWLVNYEKVCESIKTNHKDELDAAFKELVLDLNNYSKDAFSVELTTEDIEIGIIAFFKDHDLDLLFASNSGESVLPKVKESKKAKYIIAKFITDLQTKEPRKFKTVLKLAKGYAIASLMTYEDIQHYSGNLNDVEVFLDAPIIFNLLGLNGDSNLKLGQELIDSLKSNGAKLKVFEINYGEVVKTIEDAIKRLNSRNFDITKSSRVLRTAIRENISAQQLQIKLNQLEGMLKSHSIAKEGTRSLSDHEHKYQIDEVKLIKAIEELYRKNGAHKIPIYISEKIERDVEAISSIFKIRKQNRATSLKSSKAILLTSNEQIALASKVHERKEWEYKSTIPVCVTDIFLSTILWANYPTKNENLNIRQLISECYSIIELDNRLLSKFYEDINKMHKENIITDEQFYLLSASNLTYTLLEQKTLNDVDEYTDKTPSEILEDLQLRIEESLNAEKSKLSRIDNNLRKISRFFGKFTFVLIAGMLIGLSILLRAKNPQLNKGWFNYTAWSVAAIIGVFGLLRWMELIPTKLRIETAIDDFLFKKLKNILSRD